MLYPCMFCVSLSMDLFVLCVAYMTVFVNCLLKLFAICLGVVVILLLNVMCCLLWFEMLYWIDRVWSSKECVGCACDPSVRLDVPSIHFVCIFVCRKSCSHLIV